jgi:hypothetical protein
VKKQAERKAKVEALLEKHEHIDLPTLHDQLSAAYEIQAKNPMKKNKDIGELEAVIKGKDEGHHQKHEGRTEGHQKRIAASDFRVRRYRSID